MRNPPPRLTRRELAAWVAVLAALTACGIAVGLGLGAGLAVWK